MNNEEESSDMRGDFGPISDSIGIDSVISGTVALETLSNARLLRNFLKQESISKRGLLPGIKLLFRSLVDELKLQTRLGGIFDLDEDRVTSRALHQGIPITTVKSNSSLAKLLRGLEQSKENVLKETTLPDFQAAISEEFSSWFKAVRELFDNHIAVEWENYKELEKEEVQNLHAYSWYLRFLDIRMHLRISLTEWEIDIVRTSDKLEEIYPEIKELDAKSRDKLEKAIVRRKKLEEDRRIKREKERKKLDRCVNGWKVATAYLWASLKADLFDEIPIKIILQCESWDDLDNLFKVVMDDYVKKVDEALESRRGVVFSKTSERMPIILESYMIEYDKSQQIDPMFELDHCFLWYRFEILDGANTKIFPGVSTFTSLLLGTVMMKRNFDWAEPIEVRRIKHPAGDYYYKEDGIQKVREKYDISYAVLVPAFGSIGDYSGWLINLDCCNDHTGFSGGMRAQAEALIESLSEDISIEEHIIEISEFRKYLRMKVQEWYESPYGASLSESEWESIKLERSIGFSTEMSAVIIELFVTVSMAEAGFEIHWQYRNSSIIGEKEIDILAIKDDEIQIIECSRHFPNNSSGIDKLVKEMKRKKHLIRNSDLNRERIVLRYVTSKNLEDSRFKHAAQLLRKENILVENIFDLLEQSSHRTKSLKEVLIRSETLRLGFDL